MQETKRRRPVDPNHRGTIFADQHPSFLAGGYGSRVQGWEMWDPEGSPRPSQKRGSKATPLDFGLSYVVIFDYGSIVFLHFTDQQREVSGGKS